MRLTATILVFLLLAGSAALAAPQTATTGAITGIVTDNSGAIMPGVSVTVTDSKGTSQTVTANEKGEFLATSLATGSYTVTVMVQGFETFKVSDLQVTAGQTTRADAALAPAEVKTSINVVGQSITTTETENAQISGTITNEEITDIGLNGRNFTQLVALAPGVSNQTGQDEALVGAKGSVKYSVNGGRVEYNTFDIDGGDVLNASVSGSDTTLIVYPSLDAIQDLQVLTSNYGAMYGRSASGTILATTKMGGQAFHGDGYFFARNNIFNARNYFDITKRAPLYQKYDPGFTFGGPAYIPGHYNTSKDKTFFFVSEEYRHEREPMEFNQGVPSAGERNCADAAAVNPFCLQPDFRHVGTVYGDFSDVCPKVSAGIAGVVAGGTAIGFNRNSYPDCPGTPESLSVGNLLWDGFPGNLVPINPTSNTLLSAGIIPAPTSTTGCNSSIGSCYDAVLSPLTTWREDLVRLDHNFSSSIKGYFRFIHDDWNTVSPTPQWSFVHNAFPAIGILPTVQNRFEGPGYSVVAHLSQTVSTKFVNDVAMAFTTDHITLKDIPGPGVSSLARPASLDSDPSCRPGSNIEKNECPIGYLFNNGFGGKLPGIIIGGTNPEFGGNGFAVDPSYMPWRHSNPTYSPRDDATLILGNHTLSFGVLFVIAQRNEINPPVGANTGDLQGLATFSNVNYFGTTGNAFADFLEGNPRTFQQDSAQLVYHSSYNMAEPYIQDDWHVTRRLTLNVGIRFSIFGTYHEKSNNAFNFFPAAFDPSLAAEMSVNPFLGNLQFASSGEPVPLDPANLDPHLLNGMLRCGVDSLNGKRIPASCMSEDKFNPAPRIGFAWDPTGHGKMSIRGGYGVFFEHGTGNEANTGSLEGSPANAPNGVLDMTQFFPQNWYCVGLVCTNTPPRAYPLNVTSIPTKAIWPYVQQWSFSVQREMPGSLLGSIAYVGSKGTHLTAELQINQLQPVSAADNPFLAGQPITTDVCNTFRSGTFVVNGQSFAPGDAIFTNLEAACYGSPQLIVPDPNSLRTFFPGLGQVFSLQNVAASNYNAMQITLRRMKAPLMLGISYSYSHSIDDASDRSDTTLVNAFNLAQNRASSNFDQRHLLNIDYIYDLDNFGRLVRSIGTFDDTGAPSASSSKAKSANSSWTQKLLSNWQLSGVTTFASGTPFSVINGGSFTGISSLDNAGVASGTGAGSYPDLAAHAPFTAQPAGNATFGPLLHNPAAFMAPTGLTFGNAGRNALNNPSRINFDASLIKNVKTSESTSLQFRVEAFNLFNHTQFRIYDPSNAANTGNNIISCYGQQSGPQPLSAGDPSCVASSSFLHPVDAHRPRTMQLGVKFLF